MRAEATSAAKEQQLLVHLHNAGEHLRNEQVDAAEREVVQALALAPDDVRANNLLGLVRFRGGRNAEAYEVFRALVARSTDDPSLRLNLALVEMRLGRFAEAAQNLDRVVAREPGNTRA